MDSNGCEVDFSSDHGSQLTFRFLPQLVFTTIFWLTLRQYLQEERERHNDLHLTPRRESQTVTSLCPLSSISSCGWL